MGNLKFYLRKHLEVISTPIILEWPFFVFVFLSLITRTVNFFVGHADKWWELSTYVTSISFLSIAFVFSYLLTFIAGRNRKIKLLLYIVISCYLFIILFIKYNFKATICPETILLLLESNLSEMVDFVSAFSLSSSSIKVYLMIFALIVFIVILELNKQSIGRCLLLNKKNSKMVVGFISFVFLLIGCCSFSLYYRLFECKTTDDIDNWNIGKDSSLDNITALVHGSYSLYIMGQSLEKAEESTLLAFEENSYIKLNDDSLHVVFVIGESFIKRHSSLYGYELKTNPLLEEEQQKGNLFVFNNVMTLFCRTSESVRNMFSTNCCGKGEKWEDYPAFPSIFKKSGYSVLFWDNQYIPVSNQNCDYSLNSYLFSKKISNKTYDMVRAHVSNYDGDLISDYKSYADNHKPAYPLLSIFHLQGQHFDTQNHYPLANRIFDAEDVKRTDSYLTNDMKEAIAHYDNCTHYNDSVISALISLCKEESAVVVYLSDHGETIYDTGPFKGRPMTIDNNDTELMGCLFDVPFMIWCSDNYIDNHPDIVKGIQSLQDKSFTIDVVSHFLMFLGGVTSKYYRDCLGIEIDG